MLNNNKIFYSVKSLGIFFVLLSLSLFFCFYLEEGGVFSVVNGMISLFVCSSVFFLLVFRYKHFPFLLCFALALFLMPFLHLLEYVFDNSIIFNNIIFGLNPCPYTQDVQVLQITLAMAIVGVLGLLLGVLLFRSFQFKHTLNNLKHVKTFGLPVFVFISILAFFLSYIYAPQLSLFESQYAYGVNFSFFSKINFNGSWQLSYAFVILSLLDIWNDKNKRRKLIKYVIFTINFLGIVIWLQFMRGDRECFGLVVAVAVLFLLNFKVSKLKIIYCGLFFIVFVFILQYIGAARSHIHKLGRLPTLKESSFRVFAGTWSGALRSPVSVAGDFYYDAMDVSNGKTMLSLFLSIVPGPVARAFNIERPVESTHGPAWEMRYGIGGTHVIVVPYMDFKMYGVLFFLFFYGFIFSYFESLMDSSTLSKKLLYGSLFTCLPFLIWYGELSFIRGLMAWMIVYGFYLLVPKYFIVAD